MAAYYSIQLEDAFDGSGDVILNLPEQLLKDEGWMEGDELSFKKSSEGRIVVTNVTKEVRERAKEKKTK
jgi:antitoxin component of MazEF toxin-antitoxin module